MPDIQAIQSLDPTASFTPAEAAKLLGMTENGMRGRIRRNQIAFGKVGGRYYILGSAIQRQLTLPVESNKDL
jgi:hypothetical protein